MAAAILSISIIAASVWLSYGQDKIVRVGYQKYGKLVLLKAPSYFMSRKLQFMCTKRLSSARNTFG